MKQYTITIKGKVLEVGFRGYVRELCSREGVKSIVYNTEEGDLKLLCEASRETLEDLASRIKDYKFVEISDIRIEEGIELPSRSFRAVLGLEEDIFDRLDEGVRLLRTMNVKLDKLDKLDDMNSKLGKLDTKLDKLDKLDEISGTLKKISNKL